MIASRGKTKEILEYLQAGHTLTAKEACIMFDTVKLSAIVHDLRKHGYDIRSKVIDRSNNCVAYFLSM